MDIISLLKMSYIWLLLIATSYFYGNFFPHYHFPLNLSCFVSNVTKTTDKKKINSFELWCYRRLLRIKWTDKKTNEYVLSKIGTIERLLTTIVKRKMAFVGHVLRKGDICKDLLIGAVHGRRGKGRPKTRYSETFENLVGIGALLIYID